MHSIGFDGDGYCFDNEGPAHQVYLRPVRIARSLVTNAQWLDFIADGGYATPSLWLSDGWATVQAEGWEAPGYWRKVDGGSQSLTLAGLRPVDPDAPVCHVSYYEADAFARWMGKDLPTEQEWEVAARLGLIDDAFGIVWQWTRSAYSPYPGYRAASGALGEYNGKFMINQMVLRGSSHATPAGHSRATYRNFFYPPARWQFSGLRLVALCRLNDGRNGGDPWLCMAQTALRHVPDVADSEFAHDVLAGLSAQPKRLSPKYFYDEPGAQLFEEITRLPEYYPTRSELAILERSCRRHGEAHSGGRGADRVRQRLDPQGAHAARRGAGDRRLCAGRHFLRDAAAGGRRAAARLSAPDGAAGRGRLHQAVPAAARHRRPAARRLLPGIDHRQFRAA